MAHSPYLVSCISYITARFIPGYQEARRNLAPVVVNFLHTSYTAKIRNVDDELVIMQALLILKVFRPGPGGGAYSKESLGGGGGALFFGPPPQNTKILIFFDRVF
jgi:hypothetical protein